MRRQSCAIRLWTKTAWLFCSAKPRSPNSKFVDDDRSSGQANATRRAFEDYRAKLMARIYRPFTVFFCEFTSHYSRRLGLAQLLEQNHASPPAQISAQVLAAGPDVELGTVLGTLRAAPRLFISFAANANKYGATEFAPRGRQHRMEDSARSGRPSQNSPSSWTEPRRTGGEASRDICGFRSTAYQEST